MTTTTMHHASLPFIASVEPLPAVAIGDRPHVDEPYLSKTQLYQLNHCGASYWFRYGEHLKEPQNSAMLLGNALHTAEEVFFRARRDTPEAPVDPVIATATACAVDYLAREINETTHRREHLDKIIWKPRYQKSVELDSPESLEADVIKAVPMLAAIWATYEPLSAEQGYLIRWANPRTGEPDRATLPFLVYEDAIASHAEGAQVLDLKTGKAKSIEDVRRDAGVIASALAHEAATGIPTRHTAFINFIRNKDWRIAVLPHTITVRDFQRLYFRCKAASVTIRAGAYNAVDDAHDCGYCPYRKRCDEFFSLAELHLP